MKIKIGVLSDTHIPGKAQELPKKMLDDFRNADMIIHAGDLVDSSVLKALQEACKNVKAVAGNMDSNEIKNAFPEKQVINAGKIKIGVIHGVGAPGKLTEYLAEVFKEDKPDIIIFGHSHNAMNEKIGGILYFNPGSPTDKIFSPYNSYGIIEINDKVEARIVRL